MDRSKALNGLVEAADLAKMIEEILSLGADRVPSTIPGVRITVKNLRERILASHDALARELISHARNSTQTPAGSAQMESSYRPSYQGTPESDPSPAVEMGSMAMKRRDLRSSLEKLTEK